MRFDEADDRDRDKGKASADRQEVGRHGDRAGIVGDAVVARTRGAVAAIGGQNGSADHDQGMDAQIETMARQLPLRIRGRVGGMSVMVDLAQDCLVHCWVHGAHLSVVADVAGTDRRYSEVAPAIIRATTEGGQGIHPERPPPATSSRWKTRVCVRRKDAAGEAKPLASVDREIMRSHKFPNDHSRRPGAAMGDA